MEAMESIKTILAAKGVKNSQKMEINENYTIENPGYNELTIEKIDDNRLSVAHYYRQRGDLMRDPEIVFRIQEDGTWMPILYRNDGLGIHEHDVSGLSMSEFVKQWDQNLSNQGFVQAARA